MFLQGSKTSAHGVDGDMRRTQVVPPLRLAPPLVGTTVPRIHLRLDAARTGIATSLPQVAVQALNGLLHLLVRPTQRKPAVRHPRRPAQQHVCSPTRPDGDGTAHGKGVEPGLGDGMDLAVVGDDLLASQQTQHLDLLLDHAPTGVEVPTQRFVLHRVPANPYPQAQLATAQHIHFRRLLGDEHRLPQRKDDDPGDQFQLRQRRQEAKEHERLVKQVLGGIALPTGTVGGSAPRTWSYW